MLGEFSKERIRVAVAAEMDGGINLLRALVTCNSVVGQEKDAQELVEHSLAQLGFNVERITIPDTIATDPLAGVPSHSYDGRFNVLGSTPKDGQPSLLLNGHIDVVPVNASTWSSDPFTPVIRDGWLFGRGAGDMKGGFAMALIALRALRTLNASVLEKNISFLSVIEEECTGNGTLASVRKGITADAVILPEPTDLKLLLGGVPITWVKIILGFGGGHAESSDRLASPAQAVSLIVEALRALEANYNENPHTPYDTINNPYNINVGVIHLGDWASSVPAEAELEIRVGHPSEVSDDQVVAAIREIVSDVLGESLKPSVSVSFHGFRAEGYGLDPDAQLVEAVSFAHKSIHGTRPLAEVIGSTTDARYYRNQLGIPALCYGPIVRNIHGSNEAVNIQSIAAGAETLVRFIGSYLTCGGLQGFSEEKW